MLRSGHNTRNLIIMVMCWTAVSFSFYVINFYIKYFKGSIYTNASLYAVALFLGVITFSMSIRFFNAIKIFVIWFGVLTFSGIAYTFTKDSEVWVAIWILFMAYTLIIIFCLVYYANVLLFPPIHRSRIFAICNTVSRTFTIASPMVAELVPNPILIVVFVALIMTFATPFIKQKE